jgi:hypothetical protein
MEFMSKSSTALMPLFTLIADVLAEEKLKIETKKKADEK